MPDLYEVHVAAVGEVRDPDGTLVSTMPIETTLTLTEAQLGELLNQLPKEES